MKFKAAQTLKELRKILENPQALHPYLDEISPWLSRQFLSYVSELSSPYQLGMGLKATTLDDERVEVNLPSRLRTQDEERKIHTGVLVALAEQTARLYWSRHLDEAFTRIRLVRLDSEFVREAKGDLKARLQMSSPEKEKLLFEMRSSGELQAPLVIRIFNASEQMVAELTTVWQLLHQPALSGRSEKGF